MDVYDNIKGTLNIDQNNNINNNNSSNNNTITIYKQKQD